MIIWRPCSRQKTSQLRHARHRAVLVHDLADDAGRVEAGEARQVDRRLGLARRAASTPPERGPQREHVAGPREVLGLRRGVDRGEHGRRAVGGGDAGGRAPAWPRSARRTRCRTARVFCSSWTISGMRSSSSRSPVMGRQIEAAAVAGHEVDDLGRDLLRGDREVALVLAVLVVDDDDHLAGPDVLEGLGDGAERHGAFLAGRRQRPRAARSRSTYLAITSASRFTRLARPSRPAGSSLRSVYGMSATEKAPRPDAATRSARCRRRQTEPFSTR